MDARNVEGPFESPLGEDLSRPYTAKDASHRSIPAILDRLDHQSACVLRLVVDCFRVPASTIGLWGLLAELTSDWATLRKVFDVPEWANNIEGLRAQLSNEWGDDVVRDVASLRSQRKSPLRDFLSPIQRTLSADQHRGLRCVRGLIALQLLAERTQITSGLSDELKRWLAGQGPFSLTQGTVNAGHIQELLAHCDPDSPTARLLAHIRQALEFKLINPFETREMPGIGVVPVKEKSDEEAPKKLDVELSASEGKPSPDPLRGHLAAVTTSGVRVFSGVPTDQQLHTFEMEVIGPRLVSRLNTTHCDEALAALLALFVRVLPNAYARIPLCVGDGAGIWLDISVGVVCINLNELTSSHVDGGQYQRAIDDRFIHIPLPLEVVKELRRRLDDKPGAQTLDRLFSIEMDDLAKSTKSMLRGIALTSHRPTLTRLSRSWARYLLVLCQDEVYASACGIDFTVGVAANFHYVRLQGKRITEILSDAYRRIGFTGQLVAENIEDIEAHPLVSPDKVKAFVANTLADIGRLIDAFPKRTSPDVVFDTHNQVVTELYAVIHFFVAGRGMREETKTRSRMDPDSGVAINIDKRTSPYHERRLVLLAPTIRGWLNTYMGWLQQLACRTYSINPLLAQKINSVVNGEHHKDIHPMFFRFTADGESAPLGTADIADVYAPYGISNNDGRRFLDFLFRNAGLDSAAVMTWMGRGYPGQEGLSRWSTAVPLEVLQSCTAVIEKFLAEIPLVPAPKRTPRKLHEDSHLKLPKYQPQLLQSVPEWSKASSSRREESCPFTETTVQDSSLYVRIFWHWRRTGPPSGWSGVAFSLVMEDGVIHPDELEAALLELHGGTIYRNDQRHFVDCVPPSLGIRRIWLSPITVRLVHQVGGSSIDDVSRDALNLAVRTHFGSAFPQLCREGFEVLMECASAHAVIRMPALLHAWMRGALFARTSRPETVARHFSGAREYPKFDSKRLSRLARANNAEVIGRALSKAINGVSNGLSHHSAIKGLQAELNLVLHGFDPNSDTALRIQYLIHLCETQKNVATIQRYEIGSRQFLEKVASELSDQGLGGIDYRRLVHECLSSRDGEDLEGPESTAINHALAWLGIDIRTYHRSGPPPSAFAYADMPLAEEGEAAIDLLTSRQVVAGDDWHLASVALRILLDGAHRWDAVAHLRVCDLALTCDTPHLVIAAEAGANLKTTNAERVLPIYDSALVGELIAICEQRVARFPGDAYLPIFGDHDHPRRIDRADRLHTLISIALMHVTGSSEIRPHDTRDYVITLRVEKLLSLDDTQRPRGTLAKRQGLFHASIDAGHGCPDPTTENYSHNLDVARRRWIDHINADMDVPPSTKFWERVTGIADATYRKRISRSGGIPAIDPWEGFTPVDALESGAQTICLTRLAPVQGTPSLEADVGRENAFLGAALYVGLRLLGDSDEKSTLTSRLAPEAARRLEVGLNMLNRRRLKPLHVLAHISRSRFLDMLESSNLVVALATKPVPLGAINRLLMTQPVIGDPWVFTTPEDVLEFSPWIQVLQANEILTGASLRESRNRERDIQILDQFENLGLKQAKTLPGRHFSRGTNSHIKFSYADMKNPKKTGRSAPQLCFLVTVCAIALLLSTGDQT